jgi:ATP synthase F1 delta subunit
MQVRKVQLNVSTSGRYANALFNLANDLNVFDTVNKDIYQIKSLLKKDTAFHNLLKGGGIAKQKSVKIFQEISTVFGFHLLISNLLILLAKNGRLHLLEKIIADFQCLDDYRSGVLEIDLEVFKKHPALLNVVQKSLKEKFKSKNYRFNVKEKPELISGFMAFINGQCLDYSLSGRLERMRYNLKEA